MTIRDVHEELSKTSGIPTQLLLDEDVEDEFRYLWDIFSELSQQRQRGFGPQPLTYDNLYKFQLVNHYPLKVWEVRTLLSMDKVFLHYYSSKEKKK